VADWPPWAAAAAVMGAGALAGAAGMAAPALLRVRLGADEVVTTLLLNFVILLAVQIMLEGPLKDPMGMGWPQSEPLPDAAMLPRLADRLRAHAGLVIGLCAALAAHVALTRTVWGLRVRAVGENAAAARPGAAPGFPAGAAD
jgi:simple sugar transport system permease protein